MERVAATRAYFSEVKGRLAKVPTGKTVYREDVERLLKQDAEDTREHFQKMRNDAETGNFLLLLFPFPDKSFDTFGYELSFILCD